MRGEFFFQIVACSQSMRTMIFWRLCLGILKGIDYGGGGGQVHLFGRIH